MERKTNISCLLRLIDAFEQTNDEAARLRIRQAMYIHGIVDAVLSERVYLLPESAKPQLESPNEGIMARIKKELIDLVGRSQGFFCR